MRRLWRRWVCSLAGAAGGYALWLGGLLLAGGQAGWVMRTLLALAAPLATAAGFAAGVVLFNWWTRSGPTSFLPAFRWPLVACCLGALGFFWMGPILIFFGMFAGGAVAVGTRELLLAAGLLKW